MFGSYNSAMMLNILYFFGKKFFVSIVSQEIIEHLDDQIKYLEMTTSSLKRGGT